MTEATLDKPTEKVIVLPEDSHNQALVSNVHPPDWVNPITQLVKWVAQINED